MKGKRYKSVREIAIFCKNSEGTVRLAGKQGKIRLFKNRNGKGRLVATQAEVMRYYVDLYPDRRPKATGRLGDNEGLRRFAKGIRLPPPDAPRVNKAELDKEAERRISDADLELLMAKLANALVEGGWQDIYAENGGLLKAKLKKAGVDTEDRWKMEDDLRQIEKAEWLFYGIQLLELKRKGQIDFENIVYSMQAVKRKPPLELIRKFNRTKAYLLCRGIEFSFRFSREWRNVTFLCKCLGISRAYYYQLVNGMPSESRNLMKGIFPTDIYPGLLEKTGYTDDEPAPIDNSFLKYLEGTESDHL